ncbi:rab-GTPase-TBC domain-containing protein, partial [Bombardia bombarda]
PSPKQLPRPPRPRSPQPARQSTPTEATMTTIGNFSRPRKTSIRNQKPEPPQPRHLLLNRAELESIPDQSTPTQAQFNLENSTNRWPRDRSHSPHSPSSSRSSSTSPSVHKQPSNGHLNVHSRTGSLKHPTPTPTPTTATFVRPLPTNQGNNGIFPPPSRELPPWLLSGDEFRSSFRSQTTASTLQGTLFTATGTERGSIMTKTSSITEQSIINGYARTSWRTNSMADDGPSLEDVMGMYERGFTDSDIESIRRSMRFPNEDDDDTHEIDVGTGVFGFGNSRPPSSHSEVGRMSAKMLEAMNDELPIPRARAIPMPNRSPTTDSAPTYRMSLIASSLPKDIGMGPLVAGDPLPRRNGFDSGSFEKHDSAKMLDGDDDFPMRPAGNNSVSPTMLVRSPPVPTFSTTPSPRSGTPLQTAQYPQQPLEAASSRDRYGFRKESVNVNRQQYDAWDVSYTEYLSRRRKKWVTFLKDNSLLTDNPNRFPPRSAKTKRFIRKGIPPEWRGAAWFYYAGGPAILSKHRDVYRGLVQRAALDPVGPGSIPGQTSEVKPLIIEDIEKDLHRTFPDNVRFKPPQSANEANLGQAAAGHSTFDTASETEIISSLRRVLNAFALYNPRIGYCQSLNFLAGLLLLFVETEEQAFWLLNVITRVYLPGTHEMSLEGSKVDLGVLMFVMKESMPGVWKQIGGDEADSGSGKRNRRRGKDSGSKGYANDPNRLPAITLCMTAWFMSCFIGTLPMETVLRVWDVFFYEGSRTLFRIALTIFKLAEPEIKAVTDPMEMFGVVQAFPRRLIDCNALMEACYRRRNGIGHLSQEAIEEKRQERRDGIRKWRNEQEASSVSPMIGTRESEASVGLDLATDLEAAEYRRKGTLFGKRRDREQLRAAEVI